MKKSFLSFLVFSLVAGCAFTPNGREVASLDEFKFPPEAENAPYRVHLNTPHPMRILNSGIGALYERVKMIREAKNTLELEYFIFNPDLAGRIIFSELIKAAQRKVKVRVLVDKSLAVFALNEYYAKALKEHDVEIRYYNDASVLRISSVQFRNHRKLIVRDGEEAITGGRNIADEYFDLAHEFNFLDRDIWVKGEIVKSMEKTFDNYWNSNIVETPTLPNLPKKKISGDTKEQGKNESFYRGELSNYNKKTAEAKKIADLSDEERKMVDYVVSYGQKMSQESPTRICPSVAFATDREGGNFKTRLDSDNYNLNFRLLRKEIALWMKKVQEEVLLDSPYFLNDSNSREILDSLLDNDKKVTIFTNSLASTDAIYVSTVFADEVKKYTTNKIFNAYIYKGTFSDESELYSDEIRKAIWGTHSKTVVFNDHAFMVGTFNVDNRSNFYNSEMAIFCQGNPELARDVEDNIRFRMKNSHHLNEEGMPEDGSRLLQNTTLRKKGLYFMLKAPSKMLQFLL